VVKTLRRKLRRDIRRQRGAFVAITMTIFLGVTLFAATFDAFRNLDSSYNRAFREYRFANLTVTGGNVAELADRARSTPGVDAVEERVQADLPLAVGADKLLGRIVALPAKHQPAVNRVEVEKGSYLDPRRPEGVVVEKHMAETFDLAPGDRIAIAAPDGARRVPVLGTVASPEYFWPARSRQEVFSAPEDFGVVFAGSGLTAAVTGRSSPNQVAIYFSDGAENAALSDRLSAAAERLGAADVLTREQQPSNSALQQDLTSFEEMAVLFPLLFLTAAALATGILLRRMVTAQRPIIGMLRACGYERRRLVLHYISFGILAGLIGAVLGVVAGVALGSAWTGLYTEQLSIPLTVVELRPFTFAVGLGFGLATGAVAAAAPAALAASVPPAEAMRRFAPVGRGRLSLPERVVPPLRRLPVRWRMSLRSIGRNPRRAVSTVVGVVLALVLIFSFWVMIDSAQLLVNRQFEEVERQDAQLTFAEPLTSRDLDRVQRVPGIDRVEPAVEIPVSLRAGGRRYQTALIGLEPDTRMHGFYLTGGEETALPATGMLAGQFVAARLDLDAGDTIKVRVPGAGVRVQAPVREIVDEPLGAFVYASLDGVRAIGGKRVGIGNTAFVIYADGVDRERMREALSAVAGVTAFADSKALLEYMNQYLGLYYLVIGLMVLFGGAMAFALLYNVIQSNLAERSVEVATLRAAGTPFATLARMITLENVLMAAIGILPGLLIGYELARLFMEQFSYDWFSFEVEARPSSFVLSSLAILVVALLSQLPGLRAVKRLDVASVVRERSA
jgi:putative ABC transport system permease protein